MGKNLQFMANTLVASFIGFPGRLAASQMSWVEVINFLCFVINVSDIMFECLYPGLFEIGLLLVSKTWDLSIGDSFYPICKHFTRLPRLARDLFAQGVSNEAKRFHNIGTRLVSEQANLQSAAWIGSDLSRSKYSRMTQPGTQ